MVHGKQQYQTDPRMPGNSNLLDDHTSMQLSTISGPMKNARFHKLAVHASKLAST
jgi:hypothetical protein